MIVLRIAYFVSLALLLALKPAVVAFESRTGVSIFAPTAWIFRLSMLLCLASALAAWCELGVEVFPCLAVGNYKEAASFSLVASIIMAYTFLAAYVMRYDVRAADECDSLAKRSGAAPVRAGSLRVFVARLVAAVMGVVFVTTYAMAWAMGKVVLDDSLATACVVVNCLACHLHACDSRPGSRRRKRAPRAVGSPSMAGA